jgi:hypothetical protein
VEMLVAQEKWLEMNKGWYNLMKWDFFPSIQWFENFN